MKINSRSSRLPVLLAVALFSFAGLAPAQTSSSTFTYQGRLKIGGGTPDPGELFDYRFKLFDVPTGGIQLTDTITQLFVPCPDGLFTVPLDFGTNVFNGQPRWLEIAVRPATNNPTAPYTLLSPRQQITAAPHALHADRADRVADGSVHFAQLAPGAVGAVNLQEGVLVRSLNGLKDDLSLMTTPGLELTTISNDLSLHLKLTPGPGIGLTPIGNEIQVASVRDCNDYTNCYWNLLGNGNTVEGVNFLGTINSVPLELRVSNQRALRIERVGGSPNLIGGHGANHVVSPAIGVTIGGGGTAANANTVAESYGTVSGGAGHSIYDKAVYAAIGGGYKNTISTNSSYGTIAGGDNNSINTNSPYASIGGGQHNTIAPNAQHATVAGGANNTIGTNTIYATIGGGTNNSILLGANGSSILGGSANTIQLVSSYSSIGGGQQNAIDANTDQATIGGGAANAIHANADFGTVSGGGTNSISTMAQYGTIPGGLAAVAANYGQFAHASGRFVNNGDAQISFHVLRRSLPTATTEELFLDGDAATRRMSLRPEATWIFDILVTARSDAGASAGYRLSGVIKNSAGVTSFAGVPLKAVLVEEIPGWDTFVEADDVNDALVIKVVGDLVPSRWVANVRTSEVIY